jgi:F0F1-type ATP synthase membrane subunit b/b'
MPAGLYFIWKPLAIIIFAWLLIYFIIRKYSGVSERENQMFQAWEKLQDLQRGANVGKHK